MSKAKQFHVQARDDQGRMTFDSIAPTKASKRAMLHDALATLGDGGGHVRTVQANGTSSGLKWETFRLEPGARAAELVGYLDDWPGAASDA